MRVGDADSRQLLWWGVAAVLVGTVLYVGYYFVGTFAFALFLYYGTRPFNERIEPIVGSPGRASLVTILAVTIPLAVVVGLLVSFAVGQLLALQITDVETILRFVSPTFDITSIPTTPQGLLDLLRTEAQATGSLQSAVSLVLGVIGTFADGLVNAFLTILFVYYLLKEDARIVAWFRGIVGAGSRADEYGKAVDRDLISVYYGTLLLVFVTAFIAAIVYNGMNLFAPDGLTVPLPMLLALVTGISMFVPIVITKLVYVPLTLYFAFLAYRNDPTLLWYPVVFLVVCFVVLDVVPNALGPILAGHGVHTGLMIFTYIIGPILFGWYGVFLGPLILVVTLEFLRLVLPSLARDEPLTGEPVAAGGRTPPLVEGSGPSGSTPTEPTTGDAPTDGEPSAGPARDGDGRIDEGAREFEDGEDGTTEEDGAAEEGVDGTTDDVSRETEDRTE